MAIGQMSSTGKQSEGGGSDPLYRIIIRETNNAGEGTSNTIIFYSKTKIENYQDLHDYLLVVGSLWSTGFRQYGNTGYFLPKIEYRDSTRFTVYAQSAGNTLNSTSYPYNGIEAIICEEVK